MKFAAFLENSTCHVPSLRFWRRSLFFPVTPLPRALQVFKKMGFTLPESEVKAVVEAQPGQRPKPPPRPLDDPRLLPPPPLTSRVPRTRRGHREDPQAPQIDDRTSPREGRRRGRLRLLPGLRRGALPGAARAGALRQDPRRHAGEGAGEKRPTAAEEGGARPAARLCASNFPERRPRASRRALPSPFCSPPSQPAAAGPGEPGAVPGPDPSRGRAAAPRDRGPRPVRHGPQGRSHHGAPTNQRGAAPLPRHRPPSLPPPPLLNPSTPTEPPSHAPNSLLSACPPEPQILETKVRKLEQLVRLKDAKIQTLIQKLQARGRGWLGGVALRAAGVPAPSAACVGGVS